MDDTVKILFEIAAIISQTGFAFVAWRSVNKLCTRFEEHEKKDESFHDEVRAKLGIPVQQT